VTSAHATGPSESAACTSSAVEQRTTTGVPAWCAAWIASRSETSSRTSASERSSVPSRTIAGTLRPVAPNQRSRIARNLEQEGAAGRAHPSGHILGDQRFGERSPHMPGLSQGEWAVMVTLRLPFDSAERVNFTQAVLFVLDCSRNAPVGFVVETR
jgi:hypothetical protein